MTNDEVLKTRYKKAGIEQYYHNIKLEQFGESGEYIKNILLQGDNLPNRNYVFSGKNNRFLGNVFIKTLCIVSSLNNANVLDVHGIKGLQDLLQGSDNINHYWGKNDKFLKNVLEHNRILFIPLFMPDINVNYLGTNDQQFFIEDYIYGRMSDKRYTTILGSSFTKETMIKSTHFSQDFKDVVLSEFKELDASIYNKTGQG